MRWNFEAQDFLRKSNVYCRMNGLDGKKNLIFFFFWFLGFEKRRREREKSGKYGAVYARFEARGCARGEAREGVAGRRGRTRAPRVFQSLARRGSGLRARDPATAFVHALLLDDDGKQRREK